MAANPIIHIANLTHHYGQRMALDDLSLEVETGEIFALLGPNGSGKSTLFRILSTLMPPSSATAKISVMGLELRSHQKRIREQLSVVFQHPSIDPVLSARENLMHHGHLYNLRGAELKQRIDQALGQVNLLDRGRERVASFSGGMRRRVEIAKCLLTRPSLMLMDEPSTGLDPTARIDLWQTILQLRSEGVTILLTTHLMDEADRADRIAILSQGSLIACNSPEVLKQRIGGDVVALVCTDSKAVAQALKVKLGLEAQIMGDVLRIEIPAAHTLVPGIIEAAPGLISSVAVGTPTLEDVFIRLTGHRFQDEESQAGSTPLPPHG